MPDLTIKTPSGDLDAYLSVPPVGEGPWPGVVLIHDVFGLGAVARGHADHLAAAGYLAVAPDLYSRGGFVRCVKATFVSMFSGEGQATDDIATVRNWLTARDDTTDKTGIIGFCMGGGFALMTASTGFSVSAPNYGQLPKDLAVLDGACPIVGSFGRKDLSLRGAAGVLEAALTERGIAHDVKEYPDAGHGFLDRLNIGPLGPLAKVAGFGFHQPSAEDAWARILRFFDEHLSS